MNCTLKLWSSFWAPSEPDVLSSRLGLPTQLSLVLKSVWDSHSVPNLSDLPYSSCLQVTLSQFSNISVKVPSIYPWFSTLGCSRICLDLYQATWKPRGPESANLNSLLPLCFIREPTTPRGKHDNAPLILSYPLTQCRKRLRMYTLHHVSLSLLLLTISRGPLFLFPVSQNILTLQLPSQRNISTSISLDHFCKMAAV